MAERRATMTEEEKKEVKEKSKEKMATKRATMTEEEKEEVKEKDRIRKKTMREKKIQEKVLDLRRRKEQGEFKCKGEYRLAWDKRNTKWGQYGENEKKINMWHKRKMRAQRSQMYEEFDRIENILTQRMMRAARDGKSHLLDNLDAKRGMRALRTYGPIKDKPFMRRASRDKDEEVLWRGFWDRGEAYQKVLLLQFPTLAAKFKEKDEEAQTKIKEAQNKAKEREERERELDAAGRWVWDNDDYIWSVPDENGHQKSLSQYEFELEANKPKLTPEEEEEQKKKEEEKKKRFDEMWRKHQEDLDRWYEQERKEKKEELARKQREKRKEKKEALLKPIKLPIKQTEKGDYEKARDRTILERHDAMKESGMFEDNELQVILNMIL